MKKLTMILTVAALVLVAASLALFLMREDDDRPAFGLVEEVYDEVSSRIELEIVEGDAELFESITLGIKDSRAGVEVIAKEDAPPIAVGSYMWEKNHRDTWLTPMDCAQGYIDRVAGDGLERVGELRGKGVFLQGTWSESYPWVEEYLLNNPYNPELTAAYLGCGEAFKEDGEYLITVYYRLCTIEPLPERDPNDWRTPPKGKAIYTTSEELYSVVCRVNLKFSS